MCNLGWHRDNILVDYYKWLWCFLENILKILETTCTIWYQDKNRNNSHSYSYTCSYRVCVCVCTSESISVCIFISSFLPCGDVEFLGNYSGNAPLCFPAETGASPSTLCAPLPSSQQVQDAHTELCLLLKRKVSVTLAGWMGGGEGPVQ